LTDVRDRERLRRRLALENLAKLDEEGRCRAGNGDRAGGSRAELELSGLLNLTENA
jgi:hypothetical protein